MTFLVAGSLMCQCLKGCFRFDLFGMTGLVPRLFSHSRNAALS